VNNNLHSQNEALTILNSCLKDLVTIEKNLEALRGFFKDFETEIRHIGGRQVRTIASDIAYIEDDVDWSSMGVSALQLVWFGRRLTSKRQT
jgi:hypothetical protein